MKVSFGKFSEVRMRPGSLIVVSDEKFDFDKNIFVLWMYNTISNANYSLKYDMKAKVGDAMIVLKLTQEHCQVLTRTGIYWIPMSTARQFLVVAT